MTNEIISTTGEVIGNTIIEMLYDPKNEETQLVVDDGKQTILCKQYKTVSKTYVPYRASNTLIKNKIVLLSEKTTDYGSYQQLIADLKKYVHAYLDVDSFFEDLCVHYILLSWVYDGFSQLPYLRKCGDFGTGKTRFLTVVGSVCYKPILASGSSSTAAIFHILDKFRGTLILDEADFRYSDEKADLTKVLNNGFTKGYPVLRCAYNKHKEFDPVGYQVYGCKILAARKHFNDPALESRFITEPTRFKQLRKDIPNELPSQFETETLALRNKLLSFRLNTLKEFKTNKDQKPIDSVEPRINQIIAPLLELSKDEEFTQQLKEMAVRYSQQLQKDRASSIEYHILSVIQTLSRIKKTISIGDITQQVIGQYSDCYDRNITPKWIGYIVSKVLNIQTYKRSGRFYLSEKQGLADLYKSYGL